MVLFWDQDPLKSLDFKHKALTQDLINDGDVKQLMWENVRYTMLFVYMGKPLPIDDLKLLRGTAQVLEEVVEKKMAEEETAG